MKKIKKVVIVVTKVFVMQNNMRERKYRSWNGKFMTTEGYLDGYCNGEMSLGSDGEDILMDYINLKDRNGKEIYEHDLITLYPGGQVRLVIWQDQYSGWVAQKKMEDGSKHVVFFYNQKEKNNTIDVVGNLYEHPELWKSS